MFDKDLFSKVDFVREQKLPVLDSLRKRAGLRNKLAGVKKTVWEGENGQLARAPRSTLWKVGTKGLTFYVLLQAHLYLLCMAAYLYVLLPPSLAIGSKHVTDTVLSPITQATVEYAPWNVLPWYTFPEVTKPVAAYGVGLLTGTT